MNKAKRKKQKLSKRRDSNTLFDDEINYEKRKLLTDQTLDLSSIKL